MTRYLRAAAVAAVLLIGSTVSAHAQGGPPGGGPPGMGRRPDPSSLERVLTGVDGITAAQKDSLTKIEAAYKAKIDPFSNSMRQVMMAARQAGGMPDMAAITKTREQIAALRTEELAAARAVLTGAQTAKFDENAKTIAEEDAAREAQMRQRMGGNPPA